MNPAPTTPPAARALPPEDLARWADSALISASLAWWLGDLVMWDRADRWSMGQLKESVAVALFAREVGRPPASPADRPPRRPRPSGATSPSRATRRIATRPSRSLARSPPMSPVVGPGSGRQDQPSTSDRNAAS